MAGKDNKNALAGAFNEVVGIKKKARGRANRKGKEEVNFKYRGTGK